MNCAIGCSKCVNSQCLACFNGYALQMANSMATCQPKCNLPCKTCTATACLTCIQSYVLQGTNCVFDTSFQYDFSMCYLGTYLNATGGCSQCSMEGCASCPGGGSCTACFDGYYFINGNSSCVRCPTQCKTCSSSSSC